MGRLPKLGIDRSECHLLFMEYGLRPPISGKLCVQHIADKRGNFHWLIRLNNDTHNAVRKIKRHELIVYKIEMIAFGSIEAILPEANQVHVLLSVDKEKETCQNMAKTDKPSAQVICGHSPVVGRCADICTPPLRLSDASCKVATVLVGALARACHVHKEASPSARLLIAHRITSPRRAWPAYQLIGYTPSAHHFACLKSLVTRP